jgi:hypothetical protein
MIGREEEEKQEGERKGGGMMCSQNSVISYKS